MAHMNIFDGLGTDIRLRWISKLNILSLVHQLIINQIGFSRMWQELHW